MSGAWDPSNDAEFTFSGFSLVFKLDFFNVFFLKKGNVKGQSFRLIATQL